MQNIHKRCTDTQNSSLIQHRTFSLIPVVQYFIDSKNILKSQRLKAEEEDLKNFGHKNTMMPKGGD